MTSAASMIDYITALEEAGISEQVAKTHATALANALEGQVATKQDVLKVQYQIELVRKDIEQFRIEGKKDIEQLRASTSAEIELVRKDIEQLRIGGKKDIEQLRADTKQDIQRVEYQIEQLRSDTKKEIEMLRIEFKRDMKELEVKIGSRINWAIGILISAIGVGFTALGFYLG